ncbi:MAG: hypothetical protein KKD69_04300 [Euryarchaeota archaeon]|nr:hypothetical protein [Euryarchaeota archaeon]MCG2728645.1 hypothetical protein [Candidatus Methanoperedenaceae archaeon]
MQIDDSELYIGNDFKVEKIKDDSKKVKFDDWENFTSKQNKTLGLDKNFKNLDSYHAG